MNVFLFAFSQGLDLAIRNWARNDPALQKRLDKADAARIEAVAAMFRRFGYSLAQAKVRALTVIYTQTGYYSMQVKESRATRVAPARQCTLAQLSMRHRHRSRRSFWR